jgi:antitoxin VapB
MMPVTRQFKSGNSFAVRLPKAVAFEPEDAELEILRKGDVVTIRKLQPEPHVLSSLPEIFGAFSDGFMRDGRGDIEQDEREKPDENFQAPV